MRARVILSRRATQWAVFSVCVFIAAMVIVACSNSTVSTGSGKSTVNVMLSDPATCQAPNGLFKHVYVTITDVQANVSSTASLTDSTWVDLTPGLSSAPKQIDLLGQANNQCFLATLGSTQGLQAGSYQQIRILLASNSASISGNLCTGGAANCVVLSDNSSHTLNLSSEAQTGIKIPSGQIASGSFTINQGQTKDLDIDFDTCSSIVVEGNGQYRLKPVLHAGEVSTTATSINGTVLDNATGNPVSGSVFVAVEQKDAAGVDRVKMSTLTDASGGFVFCPLPTGTYDVVIVGTRSDNVMYQPIIVTGVSVGSTVGTVKLSLPAATATSVATINGTVTTQNSATPTPGGTVADVDLTVLEAVNGTTYTIPLAPTSAQGAVDLSLETAASGGSLVCPANTDCANYSVQMPSGGVYVGAWAAGGVTLTANATWATYTIDGYATVPGGGNISDCTPSEIQQTMSVLSAATVASPVAGPTLGFVKCN